MSQPMTMRNPAMPVIIIAPTFAVLIVSDNAMMSMTMKSIHLKVQGLSKAPGAASVVSFWKVLESTYCSPQVLLLNDNLT